VDKPEQSVTFFLAAVLLGAIPSSYLAGRLSDKFGRKPMIYIASALMSIVVVLFAFNVIPVFTGVVLLGLVFGLGHGTYKSVDWALACDVLPSEEDFAKDMGIWHIAMMVPQVLFLPLAGFLLDTFQSVGQAAGIAHLGYTVIFSMACVLFMLGTVFIVKIRGIR
jgi:MFS family permease